MQALAGRVHAADPDYTDGEAAITVGCMARDPGDALLLLEALGLEGANYRWDMPRVALVVLEQCRNGREFTANTLASWVPRRADRLVAAAVTWLAGEGMIEKTGQRVTSTAPGARGRKIPCWQLTLAGERLSREITPVPGMTPFLVEFPLRKVP